MSAIALLQRHYVETVPFGAYWRSTSLIELADMMSRCMQMKITNLIPALCIQAENLDGPSHSDRIPLPDRLFRRWLDNTGIMVPGKL